MLYPLTFKPSFKERVWGGRQLERIYGKPLPPNRPIGESWEISDRPGDVSEIANGPLAGKDLHWLVRHHRRALLGDARLQGERFPLLIKILDAREKLSLQVHPPAQRAAELNGEPKTEMWFITDADPGAELYVGLKRGVTQPEFERKIQDGSVADCFHRIPVRAGDCMFLPSGRIHAIGAGLVIFEIQQNSDTTYRVFDWNRVGLDGKPRELHVTQSLASMDFSDFEPRLVHATAEKRKGYTSRQLTSNELFCVELMEMDSDGVAMSGDQMQVFAVVSGAGEIQSDSPVKSAPLKAGEFCLVPAELKSFHLAFPAGSRLLRITGS